MLYRSASQRWGHVYVARPSAWRTMPRNGMRYCQSVGIKAPPPLNFLAPHQLGGPEPLLPSCPATYMRGIYIASSQSPFVHHFCPCGSHRHTSPSHVHRDAYTTTLSIIQYGIHRRSFHGLRPFDVWGMLFDTGGMHVAAAHLVSLL
jgi:hypothetical protein